ncbi:hypothetical protein BGZ60DRAFT_372878, partial [Tricladium varicosporioides]
VDSLCIIQDSSEDWAREPTTVDKFYGPSGINTAPSSAIDGSNSCFSEGDFTNSKTRLWDR